MAVVGGILLLSFCAVGLAGYTIGTIFVTRGASLAAVQNEFLAQVSHELRTPLTSIRMFIDTLREERVHDEVEKRRCLTIINQELGRLDGLVGGSSSCPRSSTGTRSSIAATWPWPTSWPTRWPRSMRSRWAARSSSA
jgi:two-component system phosphate regulon sensor histidine kinase PhoR